MSHFVLFDDSRNLNSMVLPCTDADFLFLLLGFVCRERPAFKAVIMSASIDVNIFSHALIRCMEEGRDGNTSAVESKRWCSLLATDSGIPSISASFIPPILSQRLSPTTKVTAAANTSNGSRCPVIEVPE